MSAKLEAIFGPDLLAALDERVRAIVREAGDERLTVRQDAGKKDGDEELTVREVAEMKGVRPRTVAPADPIELLSIWFNFLFVWTSHDKEFDGQQLMRFKGQTWIALPFWLNRGLPVTTKA